MSNSLSMPSKEEVAKEIGRVASTLTEDMQSAARKKSRDLGFDLTRGRLSLDETLTNLSSIRDVLLDATEKAKLVHLPLSLQYTLYSQTLKVSETLTSLVNGTDAVQALENVVDDLTSSAWQYNLHNLSEEVLGFQQKMNQLKNYEILIRKAHQDAKEFEAVAERARTLLKEIDGVMTTARERSDTIDTNLIRVSATLVKATETEQRIAGLAIQAEQHDSAATQHEANAKAASSIAQTIADKLPEIKSEIETEKANLNQLEIRSNNILSVFEQSSATALTDLQIKSSQIKTATESATDELRAGIKEQSAELVTSATKLLKDSDDQLAALQTDHEKKLKEQGEEHKDQLANAEKEYHRLVSELDSLEGQIKDSIRRATGFTLFHSFQKRQEDLVASKKFWAMMLAIVVAISLSLSIAFIIYVNSLVTFGPAFYLKLSISLPIIYAIWFCSVQYSRERRLEEEYAFKSSISISLEPYRELVEKLVAKDKPEELAKYTAFIIESVGRVFTSPMENAFAYTKDSTPAEGIIKAVGDVAKDIIKISK